MFSDLLITRDKKTNTFVGGGYTLNSSFLNAGIPPLLQTAGKKLKSRSRSRSRSPSSHTVADDGSADTIKVSSLLDRTNNPSDTFVIPAGLFMIHADIALKNNRNADTGACTNNHDDQSPSSLAKNIERFLYDGPEVVSASDDVVPSDLYERLFSMLSPSQSEAKQYWHPKAATRSNHGKRKAVAGTGGASGSGGKSRATRRIKPHN